MDNQLTDFKTGLAELLEEDRPDSHLTPEELVAYHSEPLPQEEKNRLSNHLVRCRFCMAFLRDLESFSQVAQAPPTPVRDLAAASFWRTLRPLLRRHRTRQAFAALAALFTVALGSAFWSSSERRAPRLRPGPPIHDLYTDSSERGRALRAPQVTAGAGALLILNPEAPPPAPRYRVRIFDAGGTEVWRDDGFEMDPRDRSLTLLIPPDALIPGPYRLELAGLADGGVEPVESYVIKVVP